MGYTVQLPREAPRGGFSESSSPEAHGSGSTFTSHSSQARDGDRVLQNQLTV